MNNIKFLGNLREKKKRILLYACFYVFFFLLQNINVAEKCKIGCIKTHSISLNILFITKNVLYYFPGSEESKFINDIFKIYFFASHFKIGKNCHI